MKIKLSFSIAMLLSMLFINQSYGQQCQGENPITMVLKGYKKDYRLIANNATFLVDMNEGNFSFNISLEKFRSLDSIDAKTFLDDVFEEEYFTNLYYLANVPVSKLDKETDRVQRFNVSGTLVFGDVKKQIPLELELEYMDRDLMFDFILTLTPRDLEMVLPEKYKNVLTGNIELRTDAGKLIVKY
jgi:hypothetical protein